jgi:hypothetical protein
MLEAARVASMTRREFGAAERLRSQLTGPHAPTKEDR